MPRFLRRRFARQPGSPRQDVVGALRYGGVHSGSFKRAQQPAALVFIVGGNLQVEAEGKLLKARRGCHLERRGSANVGQVVEMGHGRHPLFVRGHVAHPPAGHRVCLAES